VVKILRTLLSRISVSLKPQAKSEFLLVVLKFISGGGDGCLRARKRLSCTGDRSREHSSSECAWKMEREAWFARGGAIGETSCADDWGGGGDEVIVETDHFVGVGDIGLTRGLRQRGAWPKGVIRVRNAVKSDCCAWRERWLWKSEGRACLRSDSVSDRLWNLFDPGKWRGDGIRRGNAGWKKFETREQWWMVGVHVSRGLKILENFFRFRLI